MARGSALNTLGAVLVALLVSGLTIIVAVLDGQIRATQMSENAANAATAYVVARSSEEIRQLRELVPPGMAEMPPPDPTIGPMWGPGDLLLVCGREDEGVFVVHEVLRLGNYWYYSLGQPEIEIYGGCRADDLVVPQPLVKHAGW